MSDDHLPIELKSATAEIPIRGFGSSEAGEMRICFVLHSSHMGGAELANLELLDVLRKRGVRCYAILPSVGPVLNELVDRNVPYRVVPYKWWMRVENSPLWKGALRTSLNLLTIAPVALTLMRWRPDIVCTNTITVCVGGLAAKLLRTPHIWIIHEFGYEDHGMTFDLGRGPSLRLMDYLASVFIVNSKAVERGFSQYFGSLRVKMVYHPVKRHDNSVGNLVYDHPDHDSEITCALIGSLQPGKNQEEAIRAVLKLRSEGVRADLLIVGRGSAWYQKRLHTLVASNRGEGFIRFLGYVENPLPVIKNSDVLLMCSRNEAFGRVTVEAMQCGKPVIGAKSGGTIELIQDGFNGFLYTPGDCCELAEKIKVLWKQPRLAERLGNNGRQWVQQRFTEDGYGTEMMRVLREAMENRPRQIRSNEAYGRSRIE